MDLLSIAAAAPEITEFWRKNEPLPSLNTEYPAAQISDIAPAVHLTIRSGKMKNVATCLIVTLIGAVTSLADLPQVRFQILDAMSGQPIIDSPVELCRFAYDITYEKDHSDFIIMRGRSDKHGYVTFGLADLSEGQYVLHTAGYAVSRFSYSPNPSQLRLPGSAAGHIRVTRLNPNGGTILGNSMYDIEAAHKYFVDLEDTVVTSRFEAVTLETTRWTLPGKARRVRIRSLPALAPRLIANVSLRRGKK